jgi:hypothetical protein
LKRKRLSDSEIRSTVEKIRKRYGDYMVQFIKDRTALDAFEDRYIDVMRARMHLALFLHAEMTVVEDLIRKEQDLINEEQQRVISTRKKREKQKSLADRVFAEHKKRIAKYPPLQVHNEASEEIERLFGCMNTVEREIWPEVEKLMRQSYTSLVTSPRSRLEERIITLCRPATGGVPPRLSRYQTLFSWTPRNAMEIEKEAKKCLLDVAFFLHDLADVLKEMRGSPNLQSRDKEMVDKLSIYVHTLLDDFRLKDFKTLPR